MDQSLVEQAFAEVLPQYTDPRDVKLLLQKWMSRAFDEGSQIASKFEKLTSEVTGLTQSSTEMEAALEENTKAIIGNTSAVDNIQILSGSLQKEVQNLTSADKGVKESLESLREDVRVVVTANTDCMGEVNEQIDVISEKFKAVADKVDESLEHYPQIASSATFMQSVLTNVNTAEELVKIANSNVTSLTSELATLASAIGVFGGKADTAREEMSKASGLCQTIEKLLTDLASKVSASYAEWVDIAGRNATSTLLLGEEAKAISESVEEMSGVLTQVESCLSTEIALEQRAQKMHEAVSEFVSRVPTLEVFNDTVKSVKNLATVDTVAKVLSAGAQVADTTIRLKDSRKGKW